MSEDFQKKLIMWDKDPARLSMTHKIAQAMLNRTSPRGTEILLDYGTGTGLIALEFRNSVKKPYEVKDFAPKAMKILFFKLNFHLSALS